MGDPQSWNRYAYVENDPVNLSDPSGQGFWEDLGFAILDAFVIVFAPEALPALGFAEAGTQAEQDITISNPISLSVCFPEPCHGGGKTGSGNTGPGSGPGATRSETTGNCPTGCGSGDIPGTAGGDPGAQGPGGQGIGTPGSWGAGGDPPGALIGVNIWGRVGAAIVGAWMKVVVSPLDKLADWQDRHPISMLGHGCQRLVG